MTTAKAARLAIAILRRALPRQRELISPEAIALRAEHAAHRRIEARRAEDSFAIRSGRALELMLRPSGLGGHKPEAHQSAEDRRIWRELYE